MSKRPQNRPRLSDRAYELAERIDPDGNRSRAIEYALELAALVEWRGMDGPLPKDVGEGPQTQHARGVLRAFVESRRDYVLFRLAQGLEMMAYASAAAWPDGSKGLQGLAAWLEGGPVGNRFADLSRGDDILRILRAVQGVEGPPMGDAIADHIEGSGVGKVKVPE